jgi:hypothetical protein
MKQYCITNKKAGGWVYRYDNYSLVGYSETPLQAGNIFSVTHRDNSGEFWHTCLPIIPKRFSEHITINHGSGYDEYGRSLDAGNLYVVISDTGVSEKYFTGQNLEFGDILTISKNSFDGQGEFGTISENSHRIILKKLLFKNKIGFKVIRENNIRISEGIVPAFMVEIISGYA